MRRLWAVALAFAALSAAADDWVTVPFITTPDEVVHRMLELAGTGERDLVIDLGSGDGRIVIAAAREFGARGVGIELDRGLVEKSRGNAVKAGVADRVSFVHGDVLQTDISAATVVTVYLLPALINRLQPIFLASLEPGTRIVSHSFTMAGWRPDARETLRIAKPHPGQGPESTLYLWIVPADLRGVWQAPGTRVRVHQNFQEVELEGRLAGRELSPSKGKLRGRELVWEADGMRFEARLQGETLAGELVYPDGHQAIRLQRER
jgi:protein-L-isoaspartate O-methyltransferase